MIHWALKVKDYLCQFYCNKKYKTNLENNTLTDTNWEYLYEIYEVLQLFYNTI